MKFAVCTILDKVSREYSQPFYSPNTATAQREFLRLVKDPASAIHAFPADYSLWTVGEFDSESGLVASLSLPQEITP